MNLRKAAGMALEMNMRDEFERWAKSVMVPNLERYAYGDYKAPHIEMAWQAWQASRKYLGGTPATRRVPEFVKPGPGQA